MSITSTLHTTRDDTSSSDYNCLTPIPDHLKMTKYSCRVNLPCFKSFISFLCTFDPGHHDLWSSVFISFSILNIFCCYWLIWTARKKYLYMTMYNDFVSNTCQTYCYLSSHQLKLCVAMLLVMIVYSCFNIYRISIGQEYKETYFTKYQI